MGRAGVVAALVLLLALVPGRVGSESRHAGGLEGQQPARGASQLQRRLKRGWVWKPLFVLEEDPVPRTIGQIKSDSDRGDRSIRYALSGEGAGELFEIDEWSGEIRTLRRLDREQKASYVLQAQALSRRSQQPVEPQSEFIITVQDVNDNGPRFQHEPYAASIPEMCPTGTTVVQVTATDADDPMHGNHAKLIYSILQGEPYFSIQPKTGIIVTSWPDMDREARDQYLVVVQAEDLLGLGGGNSASTTVTVSLTDVNDNGPTFQHQVTLERRDFQPLTELQDVDPLTLCADLYTFVVAEDAAVGATVGRISAVDGDVGANARMNYSLLDEPSATFTVHTDPQTQEGVILLAKPLDFETKRRFVMAAEAVNERPDEHFLLLQEMTDRTTLKVVVEDVDEPPVFLSPAYRWKLPENAAVGTEVGSVGARDVDAASRPVRYSISRRSDAARTFRIDPHNGTITVAKALDRETASWHNLTVEATEMSHGHLSSSVAAFIKVLDINDNVPRLARDYRPYICEGAQAGEIIQLLSAFDPDEPLEGHHFYFSMVPEKSINPNFTIRDNQDNTAGIIARRSTFTRKDRSQYLLPVVVTDSGAPPLSSTSTLTISVCSCQPAGHCPSGGVEALSLSMGVSLQTLVALLLCLLLLSALLVLMLLVRRHKQKQQEGAAVGAKELELSEAASQKMFYYHKSEGGAGGGAAGGLQSLSQPPVPLRPHPRRRKERRLRREEVRASIRMSLRESHLIGPGDEVFRQFILDRLDEADHDPWAPPFDCLRSYAFEGRGSPAGSLSSLESDSEEPQPAARSPRAQLVRLTPWTGAADQDDTF